MPSLRRSLIVYFLALLALGLGTVGLIADRAIGEALAEKEAASTALIERNKRDRIGEEREKFDRELLAQAQLVARTASNDYAVQMDQANRRMSAYYPLLFLGLESAAAPSSTLGALAGTVAIHPPTPSRRGPGGGGWTRGPLWEQLAQVNFLPLRAESFLDRHLEDEEHNQDHAADYIQVNSTRGLLWKSSKLGPASLPFNPSDWTPSGAGTDSRYDTLDLPGGAVRRVVFQARPIFLPGVIRGLGPPNQPGAFPPGPQPGQPRDGGRDGPREGRDGPRDGGRDGPRDGPREGGGPPQGEPGGALRNFYHVARPTAALDAAATAIRAEADADESAVQSATVATRTSVRWTLGVSGLVAFLGLLGGGWLLTGIGLRPLRRLSDAVSRVNERDFRLPIDAAALSTELLPIHDRLTQSLEALKRAFEREKAAIADISHELRTPVAGLLATLDVALRKPRTADQYRQTLDDCRGIGRQLAGLVERVMTLAYLDAGQANPQAAPTDLAAVARDCAAVVRPLAEAQGLTLTTDAEPLPPVATDGGKLREVVMNLLHNAVEYNRPGGGVQLSVRHEGDKAVIEVRDSGIGMSPDVQARIFDRFYRADPSRTATGVHAGLGLAIVKEYVRQLDGRIAVESAPDAGSTFRVELPA